MFPLTSNEAYIKSTGERSTLGRMLEEGGNEPIEAKLNDEIKTRAALGAHNLMPLSLEDYKKNNAVGTWSGNIYTVGSLSITVNSDLSITLNGTSSSEVIFYTTKKMSVKGGVGYTISDDVANDGSSTQRLWCESSSAFPSGNRLSTTNIASKTRTALADETFDIYLQIFANQTYNNVTFKPMIRLATDSDPTYQPYAMTNQELTTRVLKGVEVITLSNFLTFSDSEVTQSASISGYTDCYLLDIKRADNNNSILHDAYVTSAVILASNNTFSITRTSTGAYSGIAIDLILLRPNK